MNVMEYEKNTDFCLLFFFPPPGGKDKKFCYSHPKLKKLEEVVVEHFKSWNGRLYLISSRQGKVMKKLKL